MPASKLIELSYYDLKCGVRLRAYADTIILDRQASENVISAIRFGGYPEEARAMADAIYGGATVEATLNGNSLHMSSTVRGYRRQISHDGIYAVATLMADDDAQSTDQSKAEEAGEQPEENTRKCYIFCPAGDMDRLFEELDHKTAAPLIPAFRDYVISQLIERKDLRKLDVFSLTERMDAWVLKLLPEDKNVVEILNEGLKSGEISIPGAVPGAPDGFANVNTVTDYLNAFGVVVANRIRDQFQPLFDPAVEPLSQEILEINQYIQEKAGYPLYDAQLAVAEATKRQLQRRGVALIVAECGSGKSKLGSAAMGAALRSVHLAQQGTSSGKSFGVVMCPSHITQKWVREISETLPNTRAVVVRSIGELDRLYKLYELGSQNFYAVFSKERARDGYMRYPAVVWNRRKKGFLCPDCMEPVQMELSDDGIKYLVNADQFFFQIEHKKNHTCPRCGAPLWAPVNPQRKTEWVKIGGYGWVHRYGANAHIQRTKDESVIDRLMKIAEQPDGYFPVVGAKRRFPLSTYIKKKLRGRIGAFIADELHEFNNASGQGDAMAELFGASKLFVGMTATLINGYSSGIFHLLYRIVPGLMKKDGKEYRSPNTFDAEYGVLENVYEERDAAYNSNRRTTKRKTKSKLLPGVSPLVYSRFLLEYTSFLSLADMGKDLPDYEEIPVNLEMPALVRMAYKQAEHTLQMVLRTDRRVAQKILSAYLNLLTVYPDQPYDQKPLVHPIEGTVIVEPENAACFEDVLPKEDKVMEIVRRKIAAGERVMVYTSWTRTDSQKKLLKLLRAEGIRTEILPPSVPTEKREAWVEKQVRNGLQVLITNPKIIETGLDLNAFTTIIFYSVGYNLFTLRQAARRSYRINQAAPRVEVYLLYYANTIQAKAVKLMASKLAVAGIIEGTISEEGLAAMSDVKDMTSQMAKELMLGIKDNVEDIASAFKRMAIVNPDRHVQAQFSATEAVLEELPPPVREGTIRTAQSRQQQELYEGLLAKTLEDQRRKRAKKAVVVDENQLSLFGPAA